MTGVSFRFEAAGNGRPEVGQRVPAIVLAGRETPEIGPSHSLQWRLVRGDRLCAPDATDGESIGAFPDRHVLLYITHVVIFWPAGGVVKWRPLPFRRFASGMADMGRRGAP